ncbi:MAG: hypothetical protein FIA95_10000 [Gemmatimonadetes bacterium]|nr:hypothetical protein [Gemmatimonadota bacterium]
MNVRPSLLLAATLLDGASGIRARQTLATTSRDGFDTRWVDLPGLVRSRVCELVELCVGR